MILYTNNNMEQYTTQEMDKLRIDPGIRGAVILAQEYGCRPMHSCAGDHGLEDQEHYIGNEHVGTTRSENTRYVSVEEGPGNKQFRESAEKCGLGEKVSHASLIDPITGKRVPTVTYYGKDPSAEHISDKQAETYRSAA